jgi:Cof subfamily protein (haloacid dehalogenase superfamily)
MNTLHVTDLDGTLLSPTGHPTDRTVELINHLIDERGLQLTYATARSFLKARAATSRIHFHLPAAVYGGAFLVDPTNGIVQSHFLDTDVLDTIVALCRREGFAPLVYRMEGGKDLVSWVSGAASAGIRTYLADRGEDQRFRPVERWDDLSARHPFFVSVIGTALPIRELAAEVSAVAGAAVNLVVSRDTYHPEETWLEITAAEANKASAIASLRRMLDASQVISFGDNLIDLPMFAASDFSVAVRNAVDEVKSAADHVLRHDDADGVAVWLTESMA